MLLTNGTVYDWQFQPRKLHIAVEGETIAQVTDRILGGEDTLDCTDCTVVPGFIDIHIHGGAGGDMADADGESLQKMSVYLARHGVTSFCPTSMTLPHDALTAQFRAVEQCKGQEQGAYIHGVRMEGPYISMAKKGAQCGAYVRAADFAEFAALNSVSRIAVVDVAPETEGAVPFAQKASKFCTVSMAHTAATFSEAETALQNGFTHATHLFNAMTPVGHREPGVPTAVFDSESATAELICDGFHVHPAVLRMAFRALGEDRAVVVSDSMRAAGCADGEYTLGGQTVYVRNGKATLADGTIAASTSNLYDEFRNLLSYGIAFRSALQACTKNPACVAGVYGQTGSIETGKYADLLVLDGELRIRAVIVKGRRVV